LMCDFWAHLENQDFGFSIHQMTSKIDDGPILHVEKVVSDRKSYMNSIFEASKLEARICRTLIDQIKVSGHFTLLNPKFKNFTYRKNPSLKDGYRLQLKGIKI
jgi:methionyl-tRNA formyltransferase